MVKPGRFGLSSRSSKGSGSARRRGRLAVGVLEPLGRRDVLVGQRRGRSARRTTSSSSESSGSAALVRLVVFDGVGRRRSSASQRLLRPASIASIGLGPSSTGGGGGSGAFPATTSSAFSWATATCSSRGLGRGDLALVGRLLAVLARARAERVLAPAREVGLEVVRADEVLDVEERRALEPDVDEGGLEPGQHPGDLAEVDVAYGSARGLGAAALDVELGDDAVLDEGDACLGDDRTR